MDLALAALPLPSEGGAPKEFRILRAGVNQTEKGDFLFDDEAARLVMAAYVAKGIDKVQVDYEHQSMQPPPAGGSAAKPAAGWFKPEVRNGELWATAVAWTATAAAMLAPKEGAPEYRFFSPVLRFDQDTKRITSLKNLALTNDPAMDGIGALAAATAVPQPKEPAMTCAECTALTTKLKAMEEECSGLRVQLSAFEKKDKDKDAAMTSLTGVRTSLVALTGQATEAGALGVVEAWKKDAADVAQLRAERAKERETALTAEMKSILDSAEQGGKLPPAQRPHEEKGALAFGAGKISKDGIEWLTGKWGAAAPVVKPNGEGAARPQETGVATLTAEDHRVAKLFGHDPKEVLAHKTALLKAQAAPGV